jgi:NADPH:quinone reductase-like Zn-dependent oxidoreductase
MKAIIYRRFGSPDVLRCEEVARPEPGQAELLVRVRAASVNQLDWHMLRGTPRLMFQLGRPGKHKPKRPGRDVAGEVAAIGEGVDRFRPGDRVFGACQGAFAEYLCGREDEFAAMPDHLSFEQAAALPIAGLTALQSVRDAGRLRSGSSILVNGATGGVGTFAVQLAKSLGAEVTAVCAGDAADLARSIGADHVVDYRRTDFTASDRRYDLIVDNVGNHSFRRLRQVLARDGRVVAVGGGGPEGRRLGRWLARTLASTIASRFSQQKIVLCMSKLSLPDLAILGGLVSDGKVRPVIDRRYRLDQVPQAIAYLVNGHPRGKVIIDIGRGAGA